MKYQTKLNKQPMEKNRFTKMAENAKKAFDGKYSKQLSELTKMSDQDFQSVLPGEDSGAIYSVLLKVVEDASRKNISQAKLVSNIKELGEKAKKLAMKVPTLAVMFEDN